MDKVNILNASRAAFYVFIQVSDCSKTIYQEHYQVDIALHSG